MFGRRRLHEMFVMCVVFAYVCRFKFKTHEPLNKFSTTTDANDTRIGANSDFKTKEDDLSMKIVSLRQDNLVDSCQTLRGKEIDTIRCSVTPVLLGVASRGAERNRARDKARRAEPMNVVPTDAETTILERWVQQFNSTKRYRKIYV